MATDSTIDDEDPGAAGGTTPAGGKSDAAADRDDGVVRARDDEAAPAQAADSVAAKTAEAVPSPIADRVTATAEEVAAQDDDGARATPRSTTAASVVDGEKHPVDPASVTVIRIVALAWVLGVATLNAAGLIIAWLVGAEATAWAPVALGVLLLVASAAATFAWWWPAVRYRHLRYQVDPMGLNIHRGVLWRSILSIPISRVQHTDVSQGPVQRAWKLATLVVYTAGTESSSVSLGGLRHEVALAVRDHLVSSRDDDAV